MKKLIVLFASVVLVLGFAASAAAADWSFYGSSRIATFWFDASAAAGGGDGLNTWNQQGNSRIGANVKADAVSGRFEYGTGVNRRILYGSWNFGAGSLLVGQTYVPVNLFMSNQVFGGDAGLLNMGGGVYGGRNPMLQLSFGSFKLAFVTPPLAGADLPKIEASYAFRTDMFSLQVVGGYTTSDNPDVDAWVLGGQLNFNLGPAKIKGSVAYAQNSANYGLWLNEDVGRVGTVDEDSLMAGVSVAFKATDMLSFEGGFSWYSHDQPGGTGDDDGMGYYVQCAITMAPGVYVIPEVGVQDNGDSGFGADEGTVTYFGAKWQINF